MDHIKLLTFVQHHSALDFVYIMALYNKKKIAGCAIYCLSVIQIGPRI